MADCLITQSCTQGGTAKCVREVSSTKAQKCLSQIKMGSDSTSGKILSNKGSCRFASGQKIFRMPYICGYIHQHAMSRAVIPRSQKLQNPLLCCSLPPSQNEG